MPPCAAVLTLLTLLVDTLAQDEQPCRCLELASGSGSDCWAVTPWLEANGLPLSDCSRYYDSDGGGRGCRIDHDNGDRCDGFSDEPYTPCDPDPADPVLCGGSPGGETFCQQAYLPSAPRPRASSVAHPLLTTLPHPGNLHV